MKKSQARRIMNYRMFEQHNNDYSEKVEEIALLFSQKLKEELTPEQLQKAIEDNRTEESEDVCHSHDYLDANMVMLDAMEEVMGKDFCDDIPVNQEKNKLWGDSWNLAKEKEFFTR